MLRRNQREFSSLFRFYLLRSRFCSRPCENDKDIKQFEATMKQRFFYYPTAALYGSSSGLFDLGPHGTSIKWNLIDSWKKMFIEEDENIFAIETASVVPEKVLNASGHVQKFQDLLVKGSVTAEYLRIDHLVQKQLEKRPNDEYRWNDVQEIVYSNDIPRIKQLLIEIGLTKNPSTSNELSEPIEFNLMFQTKLGVEGSRNAFLRPELAQGIFTNFVHLLRQTDGSLPFGVASVGNVFRNETSSRQGLIRTREFTLAELEYFFHPQDTTHSGLDKIPQETLLPILSAEQQKSSQDVVDTSIASIKESGLVTNDIILYYMHKAFVFLVQNGIDPSRIRFRQHMSNEMAHYANDCWDVEIESLQYGWIECVGIANRTNFDLMRHNEHSGRSNQLMVFVPFAKGKSYKEKVLQVKPVQPAFGKAFQNKSSAIIQYVNQLSASQLQLFHQNIQNSECVTVEIEGEQFELEKKHLSFKEIEVTRTGEHVIPHVIEPSFGINRILYCILEHSFRIRSIDAARSFLSLPATLAPITCEVLVMKKSPEYIDIMNSIGNKLSDQGIRHRKDAKTKSIGKRYSVIDEIGTPFVITIDDATEAESKESIDDATVTLRERNSMQQSRIQIRRLPQVLNDLYYQKKIWKDFVPHE